MLEDVDSLVWEETELDVLDELDAMDVLVLDEVDILEVGEADVVDVLGGLLVFVVVTVIVKLE